MSVTVIDNNDIPGLLADAGVPLEGYEPKEKPSDKNIDRDKEAEKIDAEDEEGDDGFTPRQKRELTQSVQKIIGKKHRMKKEAEEFAAAQYNERRLAEQRAEQLEREIAELRKAVAPKEEKAEPQIKKPNKEDFQDEIDYVDAMIQYGVDQRLAEKAEEDRKTQAKREQEKLQETAAARIALGRELVPDFDDVVGNADIQVPPAIAGYMQKSEMLAELGYHFAKNPELLAALSKLPIDEQLVKIGRIESTLTPFGDDKSSHDEKSSKKSQDDKAKSATSSADTGLLPSRLRASAAPVITPINESGNAGIVKDSRDMNIREAIEDFSKRNRINLGVRKRH